MPWLESWLDYLKEHPGAFAGILAVVLVYNIASFYFTFYRGGRRAEQKFKGQEHQPIRFRERGASGYSTRSRLTRLGGARGALDVVVTDAEVWLKGIWPWFSYLGSKFDMVHRIPRSKIRALDARDSTVELRFTNETGTESHVVLILKDTKAFIAALGA